MMRQLNEKSSGTRTTKKMNGLREEGGRHREGGMKRGLIVRERRNGERRMGMATVMSCVES
jgi:hypothetical protein